MDWTDFLGHALVLDGKEFTDRDDDVTDNNYYPFVYRTDTTI